MKIKGIILFFLISCWFSGKARCAASGYIEVNLVEREIRLVNFTAGTYRIDGKLQFLLEKFDADLELILEGNDITVISLSSGGAESAPKKIPWFRADLVKVNNIFFIEQLSLPQFTADGRFDLDRGELVLDIAGNWQENSETLEGQVKVKVKLWGGFEDFLASGYLTVEDGKYQGEDFVKIRIDFFGRPPLFNITDSEVLLSDGTILEIEGVLDLRDSANMIPGAEFAAQKIFIDGWQLFSDRPESVGLKKSIDGKIDVSLNAGRPEYEKVGPGTEFLYSWRDDKLLRMKLDEEGTSLRLEKRRDF